MSIVRATCTALLTGSLGLTACASESDSGERSADAASTGASTASTGPGTPGVTDGSTASTGVTGTGGDDGSGGEDAAGGGDGDGGDGGGGSDGSGGGDGSGGSQGAGGAEHATIAFGANWQGANPSEAITLCEAAGVAVERHAVHLVDYEGQAITGLDDLLAAGIEPLVNVTWDGGGQSGDGLFVGDTPAFRSRLRSFLDRYGEDLDVIVIENEPATEAFYLDDLSHYIEELKAAVEVLEDYREDHPNAPKIADGGIHVLCVENYSPDADALSIGGRVCDRQNYLIHEYAEIPGLDYVTIHFSVGSGGDGFGNAGIGGPDGLVPEEELLETSLTVLEATGHQVLSNEWSTGVATAQSIESVVAAFRYANQQNGAFPFAVVFSGDGDSDALPMHDGVALNALGQAYRDAVAP